MSLMINPNPLPPTFKFHVVHCKVARMAYGISPQSFPEAVYMGSDSTGNVQITWWSGSERALENREHRKHPNRGVRSAEEGDLLQVQPPCLSQLAHVNLCTVIQLKMWREYVEIILARRAKSCSRSPVISYKLTSALVATNERINPKVTH